MGEDATLLRNYVESGSDGAFSALVERHFNLVYATAWRIANGDAHLAQDVAQSVFADLARKAKSLPRELVLGGWLYQHTCFVAANSVRREHRRRKRERQAFEMNLVDEPSDPIWSRVGPFLDEAMSRLGGSDRDALVLRFFEEHSVRKLGDVLGVSEEAARKRVDRALEKLRALFARSGLSFSASVLSRALDSHAGACGPTGLSTLVAGAALAEAAKSGGAGLSIIKLINGPRIMTMTKAKIVVSAVAVAMTAAIITQSHHVSQLQQENRRLAQQTAEISDKLRTVDERPPAASDLNQDQFLELMRLRGQVGVLRGELARAKQAQQANVEAAKARSPVADVSTEPVAEDPVEQERKVVMAKMNFSKQYLLAMYGGGDTNDLATIRYHDQFQVVYPGPLTEITNPSQTIVLQETAPVRAADGGWVKVYGFADGSASVHEEPDGNFEAWENQHTQRPPGQ